MNVEVFTLCKAATIDISCSLSILNTFDTLKTTQIPIVFPTCTLAVKLRYNKVEEGNKTLRISFINADGKPVLPTIEQSFTVRVPPNTPTASISFPLLIQKLKLESFGDYSIDLAIDGSLVAQFPLYVRQKQ
ncbi:MAG: hypothetical protein V3V70_03520 [Candidatus Scalindua sp.]|jgi:hypothetical protein